MLTLAAEPATGITLRLRSIDGTSSLALAEHFKNQVASDPEGRWFAYFDSYRGSFVFRRPDGRLISKRSFLRMFPRVVAAISADGRTVAPAGVYPSPWSR